MTTIASALARLGTAWTLVVVTLAGLARAHRNRRDVTPLLDLGDRELRDIGLTRDDLRYALRQKLARDPSVVLMIRAVDRRSVSRIVAARRLAARLVKEAA